MAKIKGTERMPTYPDATDGMARHRGISSYGWTQHRGMRVLKVPRINIQQLEKIGYRHIGNGTSYAYVIRP